MQNKLRGNGIGWLLEQEDGLAAFGLFILLLEVAGDIPPPRTGQLVNSDKLPYEADDLRRLTGVNDAQLHKGLALLTSPKLGWVTDGSQMAVRWQSDGSHVSPKIRSDKIRSDKIYCPKTDTFSDDTHFEILWETLPSPMKTHKKKARRHYQASVKSEKDFGLIRAALAKYLKTKRVQDGYYQNGDTWVNNWRGWLEYEDPAPSTSDPEPYEIMDNRPCSICGRRLGDGSYSNSGYHIGCALRQAEQEEYERMI